MQRLSIITINLNNAAGLKHTIESVVSQKFSDFQFIIMDGQSFDESISYIKKYESSIDYWESKMDNGRYHAMNKGIRQATGKYCLFLNSGDYLYHENALKDIFEYDFDEDIVYTNLIMKNHHEEKVQTFPEKLTFYWMYTQFLGHASTIIKRELFHKISFYNEQYQIVSDWEFFLLAICKHQCSTLYINTCMAILVEGGISNCPEMRAKVQEERDDVLRNNFKCFYDDYELLYELQYNSPLKKLKRNIKKYTPAIIRKKLLRP